MNTFCRSGILDLLLLPCHQAMSTLPIGNGFSDARTALHGKVRSKSRFLPIFKCLSFSGGSLDLSSVDAWAWAVSTVPVDDRK